MITAKGLRSSVHLDLIRGLAAVAVFAGHLRAIFFVDYPELATPGRTVQAAYFFTGFGHQAVMIFFVLSGFFITSSIVEALPRWSWRRFLTDRLVRLYLVVLPGLALTAAWDWVGQTWGNRAVYEGQSPANVLRFSAIERSDMNTLLANVAFLQTVVAPPYGTNSPLWSICNEFWYYLVFPCLALAVAGSSSAWLRVAYAAGAIGILALLGSEISMYFLVWLMGAAVRLSPPVFRPTSWGWPIAAFVAGLATIAALVLSRILPGLLACDFLIGIMFAAWIFFLLHCDRTGSPSWYSIPAGRLAACSFSLYVLHMPMLAAIYSLTVGSGRWKPDEWHMLAAALIGAVVLACVLVFARLTEDNTSAVRRKIGTSWGCFA
jgi:peptidoglycan/LPS O-acetylase OafA/YrhL